MTAPKPKMPPHEPTAPPEETYATFADFWAEVTEESRETEVIRGIEIDVPRDLPLDFDDRFQSINDDPESAEEDLRELITELFGVDVLDDWRAAGMGSLELQTVVAWGRACGNGQRITWREAYTLVTTGKAPERLAKTQNRQQRRAAAAQARTARSTSSRSTGSRSSRTSGASTASRRKKSAS